ncbi:type II toxin-antitoxin system RelE/ParE family toxin [Treponema sp. R80B11-R83G3]
MRIFKNTWFTRFANKEGITDTELKETADRLETGQADADLGGDVYKMRVARPGEGKSGGYRVIVFFRSEERTFFVYGFAKSDKKNIDRGDLRVFKNRSKDAFSMTESQINSRLKDGTLIEVF